VELIDHNGKRVAVTPARGWKQPRFTGGIGGIHPVVMRRMRRVLSEDSGFPYLNETATKLLGEARQTFADTGLLTKDTATGLSGVEWFPWSGSRVLLTLDLCAKADGIQAERDNLCLRYRKITPGDFDVHRAKIAGGGFTAEQLAMLLTDLQRDRFDEYVPEGLLQTASISEILDLPTAKKIAEAPESVRVGTEG
jgi:ATP-dependent Lhr-like helicase